MVKLDQTYYVGSRPKQQIPTSISDLDMGDIACVLLTFAAWVALFMRYGLGLQAAVYVILLALLMAAGICDKKASMVPMPLALAMAVLWLGSVWFMPYGLGPKFTALGAEGLTAFFAGMLGPGWLPVLIDGVLAVPVMLLVSGLIIIIFGVATGSESLNGGTIRVMLVLGLYLGVTGSLVVVALAFACALIVYIASGIVAGRASSSFSSPLLYSGNYGQQNGGGATVSAALSVAFSVMVLLIFF